MTQLIIRVETPTHGLTLSVPMHPQEHPGGGALPEPKHVGAETSVRAEQSSIARGLAAATAEADWPEDGRAHSAAQ